VPVNRPVDAVPEVRYEGDTMIIPLVEEVVVIEKRLVVKEELHITKRQSEREYTDTVTVRRDDVTVERIDSTTP
jgi:stress response protein YsnF